jgi:uncharacterized pyridoxamine 5'-phosphate oxidase family protein
MKTSEVLKFLREQKKYYLATVEDNKPKIRPFSSVMEFEDKIYLIISKFGTTVKRPVYDQIMANPNVSVCTCAKQSVCGKCGKNEKINTKCKWLRIEGVLKKDSRQEPRQKMLDEHPYLSADYTSIDTPYEVEVFYIDNMTIEFFECSDMLSKDEC